MAWVKFVRFWRLLPYTSTVENNPAAIMATLALLPVILLAIATLITRHKMFRHFTSVLGFIAYLTLVHIITVGSVRYRYPLEPFLILLAAPSLVLVWGQVFGKKTSLVDKP